MISTLPLDIVFKTLVFLVVVVCLFVCLLPLFFRISNNFFKIAGNNN